MGRVTRLTGIWGPLLMVLGGPRGRGGHDLLGVEPGVGVEGILIAEGSFNTIHDVQEIL